MSRRSVWGHSVSSPNPDIAVSTIYKYLSERVRNNTLAKSPLYYWIDKKGEKEFSVGGTRVAPNAHIYQVQQPVGWSRTQQGAFPDPVMFRSPVHDWCGYIVQYMTLEWDRLENQAGDTRRFDREKEILKAVKKTWEAFYETKFWLDGTTADPAGIIGLPGFMKNSGTYGTITQVTNPTWTPTLLDGASGISGKTFATDPMAYFRRMINNHAQKGPSEGVGITDKPSIAFMTQSIFEFLLSYHTSKGYTPVTVSTDEFGFKMGSVAECGVNCYWSPSATSAEIQFLNPEDMVLMYQTPGEFVVRMPEIPQPIGEAVQIYNKLCFYCANPWNQARLFNTGVTA